MDTLLVILIILNLYLLLFYRLMCRYHFEKTHGVRESAFGAIFTPPPYKLLPLQARKYHKRYWIALGCMCVLIVLLIQARDFSYLATLQ